MKLVYASAHETSVYGSPGAPGAVILKVGTLDDPSAFGEAQMAIFLCDKQSFHHVPDGAASFERTPGG